VSCKSWREGGRNGACKCHYEMRVEGIYCMPCEETKCHTPSLHPLASFSCILSFLLPKNFISSQPILIQLFPCWSLSHVILYHWGYFTHWTVLKDKMMCTTAFVVSNQWRVSFSNFPVILYLLVICVAFLIFFMY